jgi:hypothetical protein
MTEEFFTSYPGLEKPASLALVAAAVLYSGSTLLTKRAQRAEDGGGATTRRRRVRPTPVFKEDEIRQFGFGFKTREALASVGDPVVPDLNPEDVGMGGHILE